VKVVNIHTRVLKLPLGQVAPLLHTLATDDDQMLATHKWPRMRLDNGLNPGSTGGHGPIGYTVSEVVPGRSVTFEFNKPKGFKGWHRFETIPVNQDQTLLRHTIEMQTSGVATIQWHLAIRWLHDAYVEDAFDKIETNLTGVKTYTPWSGWVRFLRRMLR
jgi:hypothetical protein